MFIKNIIVAVVGLFVAAQLVQQANAHRFGLQGHEGHRGRRHLLTNYSPIEQVLAHSDADLLKMWRDISPIDMFRSAVQQVQQQRQSLPFDAVETDRGYEIMCDLPGIDKKDISISVQNNELTISANRKTDVKEEGSTYRRVERYSGEISRTIVLPDDINKDNISAENKDGVLKINIPKLEKPKEVPPPVVQIEIK